LTFISNFSSKNTYFKKKIRIEFKLLFLELMNRAFQILNRKIIINDEQHMLQLKNKMKTYEIF